MGRNTKNRPPRKRSPSKIAANQAARDAQLEKRQASKQYHLLSCFPGEFLRCKNNQAEVQTTIAANYNLARLRRVVLPKDDNTTFLVPVPPLTDKQKKLVGPAMMPRILLSRPGFTPQANAWVEEIGQVPFLLARFVDVLTAEEQSLLYEAYQEFLAANPSRPEDRGKNRSDTAAYHFCLWAHYKLAAFITRDSLQLKLKEPHRAQVLTLLDKFLSLVISLIVPRLSLLVNHYAPQHIAFMAPVYEKIEAQFAAEFLERPALKLGPLFFAVAVKHGSSQYIHLDGNDFQALWTFIVVISSKDGKWMGGDFFAPQLGGRIPVRGGQAIAAQTKILAHCGMEVHGEGRLVLTCFSHNAMVAKALFGPPKERRKAVVVG
ncbi:hypothetical protein R3P38DRAFT_3255550 [Favolaschia claudopus]|uniref:Prolyl 4-hydroxylase alpha subunit domain-containing protein n=1 Tax=Favolaschia claudopus TaxID=2862362 RepID=A0AAW0DN63_9AGAR